jgi:hypothetical protein
MFNFLPGLSLASSRPAVAGEPRFLASRASDLPFLADAFMSASLALSANFSFLLSFSTGLCLIAPTWLAAACAAFARASVSANDPFFGGAFGAVAAAGSWTDDLLGDESTFAFPFVDGLDKEGTIGLLAELDVCGFRDFPPAGVCDKSIRFGALSIIL